MIFSLLIRFRKNPVLNAFLLIVIALHFFFLLVMLISPAFVFHKKQHKPLIVKTILHKPVAKTTLSEKKKPGQNAPSTSSSALTPAQKAASASKQQGSKAQAPPKKEQASKNLSQKSAPSVKKEPAIADKQLSKTKQPPAPAQKKSSPQNRAKISDSLLKELEESIAKIENKSDKGTASKKTPLSSKALTPVPLQIDIPSSELLNLEDGQSDYADILVHHLHQCLSLPDYGEVKIQLNLRQDGTVAKVIVLKTQSEKNKQYLERNLPQLRFPRFDGSYADKKEYTFILTFCNEL